MTSTNSNILTCCICGKTCHHSLMETKIYRGKNGSEERSLCQKCSGAGAHKKTGRRK